jgi:hypothetical protein
MALSEDELRSAMRKRFEVMTMGEWCRFTGCNKAHVSEFMSGKKDVPPRDMLKALNLEVRYVRSKKPRTTALETRNV